MQTRFSLSTFVLLVKTSCRRVQAVVKNEENLLIRTTLTTKQPTLVCFLWHFSFVDQYFYSNRPSINSNPSQSVFSRGKQCYIYFKSPPLLSFVSHCRRSADDRCNPANRTTINFPKQRPKPRSRPRGKHRNELQEVKYCIFQSFAPFINVHSIHSQSHTETVGIDRGKA